MTSHRSSDFTADGHLNLIRLFIDAALTSPAIKSVTPTELDGAYSSIERYYTGKLETYGATPRGVDWESLATQEMRFVQLVRVCDFSESFSLNDLGCGYGALLALLFKRHNATTIDYLGVDLSKAMVLAARKRWIKAAQARFVVGRECPRVADYSVASGIFNVQLNQSLDIWTEIVERTLRQLHESSRVAFSVNFLAQLPLGHNCAPELYCAAPKQWIDFCRQTLEARVELCDDYGMQEFTLHVYRS